MGEAKQDEGDPELMALFDEFGGRLISPGAAALLGVSRKTIHTLGERGRIRMFRSSAGGKGKVSKRGPKWVLIPLVDLKEYAE